jgi:hypothetical protein
MAALRMPVIAALLKPAASACWPPPDPSAERLRRAIMPFATGLLGETATEVTTGWWSPSLIRSSFDIVMGSFSRCTCRRTLTRAVMAYIAAAAAHTTTPTTSSVGR